MTRDRILLSILALVLLLVASAFAAFYSPKAFLPALCLYAVIMFVVTNWNALTHPSTRERMSGIPTARADDRADTNKS